ncbi:MAG: hypothetical protein ACFFED_17050 [Candidatus Thorarchaeota archaeon]
MNDDERYAIYYGLLLQGGISSIFGFIGFLQGQPYVSDELAQLYFTVPLAIGLTSFILGILLFILVRIREEPLIPRFPRDIGEYLLVCGIGGELYLSLAQMTPEWFSLVLYVPIVAVFLSSLILLLRADVFRIVSGSTDYTKLLFNMGLVIIVCSILLDIGSIGGFILGLPNQTTMTFAYLNGILFLTLGFLTRIHRDRYSKEQAKLQLD